MAARWIEERKKAKMTATRDSKQKQTTEDLERKILKHDGPEFWDGLLPVLCSQCDDMDAIGYRAKAYSLPNQFCATEKCYRIDVHAKTLHAESAYAMLVYHVGDDSIDVSGDIPKVRRLDFVLSDSDLKVVPEKDIQHLSKDGLAEFLLAGLVKVIEKGEESL